MSKLIIIDGMDNTGKSTVINKLYYFFNNCTKCNVKIIKFDNPLLQYPDIDINDEKNKDKIDTLTTLYYDKKRDEILNNYKYYSYLIIDRSWISEYVYGPIYRHRDRNDIINEILYNEYKVISVFGIDYVHMYLFTTKNFKFLEKHEDGNSLSKLDMSKLSDEYSSFIEAFNISMIKHKNIIDIYDTHSKTYSIYTYPNIIKNILYKN